MGKIFQGIILIVLVLIFIISAGVFLRLNSSFKITGSPIQIDQQEQSNTPTFTECPSGYVLSDGGGCTLIFTECPSGYVLSDGRCLLDLNSNGIADEHESNSAPVKQECEKVKNNLVFSTHSINPEIEEVSEEYYHYILTAINKEDYLLMPVIRLIVYPEIAGKCIKDVESSSPSVVIVVKPQDTTEKRLSIKKIEGVEWDETCREIKVEQDEYREECI